MTVNELVSQLQELQQDGHGEREIDWQYNHGSLEIEVTRPSTTCEGTPLLVFEFGEWQP